MTGSNGKGTIMVPMVDLQSLHRDIQGELDLAIDRVMVRGDFILGEDVVQFEEEFAAYCGARYALGVDCGLSALELSLRAAGIGPGDEVIVPALSIVATSSAVIATGARPVFVDVNPDTFCIDVGQAEAAVTPRTSAIVPVHLCGLPADMDPLAKIALDHGLFLLEDAAQAHGAQYKGRRTGSLGHAAAFSFYPTKNLGALGDGGMVVTNDARLAEKVRALRNVGQTSRNRYEMIPLNRRLDTIQAAILRVKLKYLESWNEARRASASHYSALLDQAELTCPMGVTDLTHNFHLYVIRTPERDRLKSHLRAKGVESAIHYPLPAHLQPFYSDLRYQRGQMPVAERLSDEMLSLPIHPNLSSEQIEHVVWESIDFVNGWTKTQHGLWDIAQEKPMSRKRLIASPRPQPRTD